MSRISNCLWFDGQAEEVAAFYTGLIADSQILETSYFGEGSPGEPGKVMAVTFTLGGVPYMALNGGPHYKHTPAFSIVATCQTQEEVDFLWDRLTEGGEESQCGWLIDRFGVAWQVVPEAFIQLLQSEDRVAVKRAVTAMLGMRKLDLPALQRAYDGV